jgi:glucokinase
MSSQPFEASRETLFLVADVGGTNTRVALGRGTDVLHDTIRRYRNQDFADLAPLLSKFRNDQGRPDLAGACIAVAGPVEDGVATLTNLDWSIDRGRLSAATGAPRAHILNDLQAQGHALDGLSADVTQVVIDAPAEPRGPRLVVGVGTGFNAAPVYQLPRGRFVPPCEAGHVGLPIRTESDLGLADFVTSEHGFPSVEDVLSGRGLERIYAWLMAASDSSGHPLAAEIMARIDDDPLASRTVALFVRFLGAVVGDLALIHLPAGGIFLVGGVARAVSMHLARFGFVDAFQDKGRFTNFMTRFPVTLVTDDFAALAGCASALSEDAVAPT